tara:strand:+ start:46 stop:153 length:108 start_codon:yes stop_codon:yes gene_type:complete
VGVLVEMPVLEVVEVVEQEDLEKINLQVLLTHQVL